MQPTCSQECSEVERGVQRRLQRIERPRATALKRCAAGRRIARDRDGKEKRMYARLISFSGADPEKRERALQTIRETVIPTLREYDGFAGYIALYDQQNRRAKALLLWDSEEQAEAAEQTLVERRRQMASGVGLTVESADLYEALVVELETARV
jgi:hypothetical protein